MKKEDKKRVEREEKFSVQEVQLLVSLVIAGVMGVGGKECAEKAEELPERLQKMLIAAILAAQVTMAGAMPDLLGDMIKKHRQN